MEDICQAIYDACLFSISHPLQAFEGWLVSLKENADHKIISRSHWIPAKNFISIFQYLSYSKRHLNYLVFYPKHAFEMSVICSPESWFILWNKQASEHFLGDPQSSVIQEMWTVEILTLPCGCVSCMMPYGAHFLFDALPMNSHLPFSFFIAFTLMLCGLKSLCILILGISQ